jgi:hypothetical protein
MSYCCNVAVVVGTGEAEPVLSWLMVPVRAQGLSISPGLLLTCLWPNAAYRLRVRPSCGGCSAIHTGVRKGPAQFARVAALADPGNRRSSHAASRSRLVTSLVLAAPGISALFLGEEFLEDKIWSDDCSYNGLIYWAGLTTSDSTMRDFLQFTKDLLKLRNSQAAFSTKSPFRKLSAVRKSLARVCPGLRPAPPVGYPDKPATQPDRRTLRSEGPHGPSEARDA